MPGREENSVQGVLRVNEEGATLELAGVLDLSEQGPGEVVQGQIVFGRDERDRAVTLLDASPRTRHISPTVRLTVEAFTVLIGQAHPAADALFQKCSFSLDGLAEWAESHFRLLRSIDPRSGSPGDRRESDHISFEVPTGRLTLFAGVGERLGDIERSFKVESSWNYEPTTPKSLDDLWHEVIRPLEYLHVLFTSEPTGAFDVNMVLPFEPGTPSHQQVALRVHSPWARGSLGFKRRRWEWPVTLNEIAGRLPEVVRLWLELMRLTEPALDLLFAILGKKRELYLENRYLSLSQAAEAFHRHHPKFDNRVFSEQEFTERLMRLRQVAEQASWWIDWLKPKLEYAYEPTFRRRVRELVAETGEFGERFFPPSVVDRVVRRRNELTHVLEPEGAPDERYVEIAMLCDKLALLLKACLLVNLGFGAQQTIDALMKSPHQRFVAEFLPG
jgi:hypothetical protein